MKKKITILLLMLVILLADIPLAFAKTQSQIQSEINAKQNEINKKKKEKDKVTDEISDVKKQIESLNSKIGVYETEIEQLSSELVELETTIAETQAKLEEAERNYSKQEEAFQSRIVAQYEAGETTYLDIILSGGSVWDMVSNWQLVSDIAEIDNNLLEQMEKNKRDIEVAKETLETSKLKVEILKNNKESTKKSLENSQVVKEKFKEELTDDKKQIMQEIDELIAEQGRLEVELENNRNKYSGEIANLGGTGILQRPVKGGRVTARQYYSWGGYHGAIDYGVPVGTPVYAAADGVVLIAGWAGRRSYGYYVVLQHADGLRTYYGHGNGVFYVSEGQVVQKGQAIMQSGNTGNSTGPHLHFEVRVAPYRYIYGGGPGDCRRNPSNYM